VSCEVSTVEILKGMTPLAKSLVLSFSIGTSTKHIATSNAMMRTVASIAPASGLLGGSDADDAMVDSWLSFVWSSIDLPLYAWRKHPTGSLTIKFDATLHKVETHLMERTYIVGRSMTLADISLAVSLQCAGKTPEDGSNLSRWYQTILHQPFFAETLALSLP
jgi:elongation factor 1-gamma